MALSSVDDENAPVRSGFERGQDVLSFRGIASAVRLQNDPADWRLAKMGHELPLDAWEQAKDADIWIHLLLNRERLHHRWPEDGIPGNINLDSQFHKRRQIGCVKRIQ